MNRRARIDAASALYMPISPTLDDALEAGRQHRRSRLLASDMVTLAGAALVSGLPEGELQRRTQQGTVIALDADGETRYPRWQFEHIFDGVLPELLRRLGPRDGWAVLDFLETPHGALGGKAPRMAIEEGFTARVLDIANGEP